MPNPDPAYRPALTRAVGAALSAGLVVALLDGVLAARGAPGASVASVAILCLGLYAWPCLAAGLGLGLIAGSFRATFGAGAVGRAGRALRDDRRRDVEATAALLAGLVVAALAAVVIAVLALKLVAGVERKSVGALLLGGVAVAALPALASVGLPLYRLARGPARLIPPVGPLPGALVALALALGGVALLGAAVVVTRLDWRVLDLGPLVAVVGLAVLVAVAWSAGGALGPRLGAGGAIAVAVGALVAAALPPLVLREAPAPADVEAVAVGSSGARALVAAGRALRDRDGDGVSGFLGGPDCDDARADVHPGAAEVPGNGIDDNCLGGDRAIDDTATAATAPAVANRPPPKRRFDHLVFIAIDTLRADRIGAAGYRRDGTSLTPRLDRLIGESAYFTAARAQSPNTPRSFPSFLTSRYPSMVKSESGFVNYPDPSPANHFLFEALGEAGIATRGHASHFYFGRAPGATQGIEGFDNAGALDIAGSNKDTAAPRVVPRAIASLEQLAAGGERFALFVHLFEPHSTYVEHEGWPITERGTASLEQKYDYEIAYVDGWIGKLVDAIDASPARDRTLVVVVSDHGEAFGVHKAFGQRMFFHGQTLYDELLRVPLILRLPGVAARRIDVPVALIDVGPTIAELLGVAPPTGAIGRSLVPAIDGGTLPPRPVFAELLRAPSWDHEARAMVSADGRHKLIQRDGGYELYDLMADPEERTDLAARDPKTVEAMEAELVRFVEVDLAR